MLHARALHAQQRVASRQESVYSQIYSKSLLPKSLRCRAAEDLICPPIGPDEW